MTNEQDRLRTEYLDRDQRFSMRDTYTLFNPGNLFMYQERQRSVIEMLRYEGVFPLTKRLVLEVGCGTGGVLCEFLSFGAHPQRLHGIDLFHWRIMKARSIIPHIHLACADGQKLPYRTHSFDLVLQFTVFSSILDDEVKQNISKEMLRVLKPDGLIVWYDFWINPTNPATRGIRPAEIKKLFPGCRYRFRRVTLAPPIARRVAPRSWLAAQLLESLPFLRTHYLVAIRKLEGHNA